MFAFILILASIFLLTYAIFLCTKMITTFTRSVHKKAGRIMLSIIVIVLIGYIIYLIFSYDLMFSNFIVAILFFFTAFFIMLVLHVNHSLIIRLTMKSLDLKDFSEQLLAYTKSLKTSKQQLETIKAALEAKNMELEASIRQMSAGRLAEAKELVKKEAAVQKQSPDAAKDSV
jgi:hypothetical protein